jgi:O-succinylhomoserine sulfhydrylase
MPQYGVETETVASTDLSHWERALSKPTNAVFLETPSNPMMQVLDIEAIAELAHKAGARLIVDNVFATPLFQKPLELGADVVMYSTTKHIDGQGRTLGGAVLTNDEEYYQDHMRMFIRHTGPTLSPFNAWVLTKSLETLELRVRAQAAAATAIAEYLDGEAGILKVVFPGLDSHPQADLIGKQMTGPGTVVVFELNGDQARTFRFMNALRLIDISNNLGDAKSMITHPTTTTHQRVSPEERAQLGIHENMVRLSVGLEDVEDLKEDIAQAIKA